MKYYYLDENNVQFGPMEKEELLKQITEDSYVWTDGMKDWEKAKYLPLFANNFNRIDSNTTETQLNYSSNSEDYVSGVTNIKENLKPNSNLPIAIVAMVLFGIMSGPFAILGLINAIKCETKWRKDYNAALTYSRKARTYSIIAIPIGFIVCTLYFAFIFSNM